MSKVIEALAQQFRTAIQQAVATRRNKLIITLHSFPNGACGDASLLLGKHLFEQGHGKFGYVLGERAGHSHAWLRKGRLVVDITADQFEDFQAPVFVGRSSPWHRSFRGRVEHEADYDIYDEYTRSILQVTYATVCSFLPKACAA
jgi:hypothetical protein